MGQLGGGGGHSWEGVGGVAQLGVGGGRHDQQVPQRPRQALALGQVDRQHDLLGLRLLALHHLVVDLVEVDLAHSLHRVLAAEGHKAEAPVSVGLLVVHQHRVLNLPQSHVTCRAWSI